MIDSMMIPLSGQ